MARHRLIRVDQVGLAQQESSGWVVETTYADGTKAHSLIFKTRAEADVEASRMAKSSQSAYDHGINSESHTLDQEPVMALPRNRKAFMGAPTESNFAPGSCCLFHYGDGADADQSAGVLFGCPCGCGHTMIACFRGHGRGAPEWEVTGEWPNVTLVPSLGISLGGEFDKRLDGYHWHGHLKNGTFEEMP